MKRLLLMGNPNVGKSVFFSRLTGTHVISSNYPGTTVEFVSGEAVLGGKTVTVVDVPGSYTLEPTSRAEEVACAMVREADPEHDLIVNVVDATNLERNLSLTLELMEQPVPVIVALNLWDEAKHLGIRVDTAKLEEWLGVPVVPTAAISGEGFARLIERLAEARAPRVRKHDLKERWADIGRLLAAIQQIEHRHHTWVDRLQDLSIRPLSGIPIAAAILAAAFLAIRFAGEGLIDYVFDPIFDRFWMPVLERLSALLGGGGIIHDVLIGHLIDGRIDYVQSFGILSTALYVEFDMVLPYIVAFYFVLGLLEDSGYLPRLAVMMDSLMHRLGLHGFAIVPMLLSIGCNVPGILATRTLESRRERFITCTLISIGIPCAALQAMIFGIVGHHGALPVLAVYGTLAAVWLLLGVILNRLAPGFSPELLMEIPPYRWPSLRMILHKIVWRIHAFLVDAVPVVLGGVFVVNILYQLRVLETVANWTAPLVTGILGLPREAVLAIVIGFFRKDVAMGLLVPLALDARQLVVASVVLAMFFPCIATFAVLWRELGWKDMLKATGLMIAASLLTGAALNILL